MDCKYSSEEHTHICFDLELSWLILFSTTIPGFAQGEPNMHTQACVTSRLLQRIENQKGINAVYSPKG